MFTCTSNRLRTRKARSVRQKMRFHRSAIAIAWSVAATKDTRMVFAFDATLDRGAHLAHLRRDGSGGPCNRVTGYPRWLPDGSRNPASSALNLGNLVRSPNGSGFCYVVVVLSEPSRNRMQPVATCHARGYDGKPADRRGCVSRPVLVRDAEVADSNPVAPTIFNSVLEPDLRLTCPLRMVQHSEPLLEQQRGPLHRGSDQVG